MDKLLQTITWKTIFLACILGSASGYPWDFHDVPSDCLDVAIVGGGIGGTYTGYRLRNYGMKISLFEYSDRIGGRMFTAKIPTVEGTTIDFGAMRLKPNEHTSLVGILNEVGLNIVDFPQNFGNPNETVYYLRGRHLRADELGGPLMPYDLRPEERLTLGDLRWKLFTENTNMSRQRYPPEEEIYTIYTTDGLPLYKLTLDQFYKRYASREAYNYIRDAGVWHDSVGAFGAHLGLTNLVFPGDENKLSDLKTIQGGFARLPNRLASRFLGSSRKHKLHLNHHLVAIEEHQGYYDLRFACKEQRNQYMEPAEPTDRVVCAKKVVLAMQRDCVERIDFQPFRQRYFRHRLNSAIDIQAQKIFLAYPYMWWKQGNENITHARSDLPTKFTYDWRNGTNGFVIHLPSYSDGPQSVALWRQLQSQGSTIYGSLPGEQRVTTAVRSRIHQYMSSIYRIPLSRIPPTVGGAMQLWDRFPFRAAWHYYKPGYKMAETRDYMLKPFPNHDVFIVSNSWWPNDLQSWSESTLRMVNLFMHRYM